MTRYVFITGGVVSSLGKGIAAAALGALLQARGWRVRLRKFDPYLNLDPGTMSPYQHGEVFVTEDGAETDLDLGHYERFTGVEARRSDSWSAGRIYWRVITRERRGDYLGATVQVVPHVTDAIKEAMAEDVGDADIVLCEIGGTVGDIESLPFLEAIRQFALERPPHHVAYVHVTLVPWIPSAGELKTKPTQHSVRELRAIGIQPDVLLCRCDRPIPAEARRKIALQCSVREDAVIPAIDCRTTYEVPLSYHAAGFDRAVLGALALPHDDEPDLSKWRHVVERVLHPEDTVRVAIVGKYTNLADAYKSLHEALVHGGIANNARVEIEWVDAEAFAREVPDERLQAAHAVLVPGGFGERGVEGKLAAVTYAREKGVPFLGICFGMQLACIEIARSLAGLRGASSTEFGPCEHPVVGLLTEWEKEGELVRRTGSDGLGGTMRLGAYPCVIEPGTLAERIYGRRLVRERHRHRYEVNVHYRPVLERVGLRFSGMSPDGRLPEIVELTHHPWFVGVQFHPEFRSRPFAPHPLFAAFIAAALEQSRLV